MVESDDVILFPSIHKDQYIIHNHNSNPKLNPGKTNFHNISSGTRINAKTIIISSKTRCINFPKEMNTTVIQRIYGQQNILGMFSIYSKAFKEEFDKKKEFSNMHYHSIEIDESRNDFDR